MKGKQGAQHCVQQELHHLAALLIGQDMETTRREQKKSKKSAAKETHTGEEGLGGKQEREG